MTYNIKPKADYKDQFLYTSARGGEERAFGFSLFNLQRTCSAQEVAGAWCYPAPSKVALKRIAEFIRDKLHDRMADNGIYLSFQHDPGTKELLEAIGFYAFCTYPGNEGEMVTGYSYTVRPMNWTAELDEDSEWDEFDDEE